MSAAPEPAPASVPEGFAYDVRPDGTVAITRRGAPAAALTGPRAASFLSEVGTGDPQSVMARWSADPGSHDEGGGDGTTAAAR
ncbi:hypothetical protein [Streptomyces sp. RFCAC02]|uniref:hypothetical protein n=1 Tax=Streptomyces sp. RFCAC02 TaxID=2499143 RepID=UPI00101F4FC4|nr:hypothetical protein [Streptomyces sp. RFCAC02]